MDEQSKKCYIRTEYFSILLPCKKRDEVDGQESVMNSCANPTWNCLHKTYGSSMFFKFTVVGVMTETCRIISKYTSHVAHSRTHSKDLKIEINLL